jgi:N-formylglutamate amidohydrolase
MIDDDDGMSMEDDEMDEEQDESLCPYCGQDDCCHLLAWFDLTFSGEGDLNDGCKGGKLDTALVDEAVQLVRKTAVLAYLIEKGEIVLPDGEAPPHHWMRRDRALRGYWEELASHLWDQDFDGSLEEGIDEVSVECYPSLVRELRADLVHLVRGDFETTRWSTDIPLFSSDYEAWWARRAESIAKRVGERLQKRIVGVEENLERLVAVAEAAAARKAEQARWAEYRKTVFELPRGGVEPEWFRTSDGFSIVSAYNPGRLLSEGENHRRHRDLREAVASGGHALEPVSGRSPDGAHEEPSLAIDCTRAEAVALGRDFGQDAVFSIEAGRLHLVSCREDGRVEEIGAFADRLAPVGVACVLHVPHASTRVPSEVADELLLEPDELAAELAVVTDHFTDELFAPPGLGFRQVRFDYSRLVVDPERFEDDAVEPMARKGWGVVYERTSDGRPLRTRPTAQRRKGLLDRYHQPHHWLLTGEVDLALIRQGRALIVDGHSFPDTPLPCDLDQSTPRPDICLGTDAFHTPPALVQALREACEDLGWSVAVDRPYAGAIVPARYLGRDRRVSAVMIEVNRRLYLTGDGSQRSEDFAAVQAGVQRLIKVAMEAVRQDGEETAS